MSLAALLLNQMPSLTGQRETTPVGPQNFLLKAPQKATAWKTFTLR